MHMMGQYVEVGHILQGVRELGCAGQDPHVQSTCCAAAWLLAALHWQQPSVHLHPPALHQTSVTYIGLLTSTESMLPGVLKSQVMHRLTKAAIHLTCRAAYMHRPAHVCMCPFTPYTHLFAPPSAPSPFVPMFLTSVHPPTPHPGTHPATYPPTHSPPCPTLHTCIHLSHPQERHTGATSRQHLVILFITANFALLLGRYILTNCYC